LIDRVPKGLRKLEFSFTDTDLTHFGGLVLLQRFCQRLGLRRRLQREVPVAQRQGDYNPADLVLALIFVMVAGLRRVSKTQILQYNGAFLSLLGLEHFPDPSSLRRFLNRLSPQTIRQLVRLHDRLRASLTRAARASSSLVLDLDSVVITLYGHQQGARLGYNPKSVGAAPITRCCASKLKGGSFGTARCALAIQLPIRQSCPFWNVAGPKYLRACIERGSGCVPMQAFSVGACSTGSNSRAGVMSWWLVSIRVFGELPWAPSLLVWAAVGRWESFCCELVVGRNPDAL
jgi:hypothetical protein